MEPTPFFVGGAGRSGSTFLYYLLRAHRKIAITNEAKVMDGLALALEALTLPYGELSPIGLRGLVAADAVPAVRDLFVPQIRPLMLAFYRQRFGAEFTHYGDKLPGPHCLVSAKQNYPETKVLLLLRDPRDVVSSYKALQSADYEKGPLGEIMDAQHPMKFAEEWCTTYRVFLDGLPEAHLIRYEDLIQEPKREVSSALDFLGLSWTPEVQKALTTNDTIGGHGTSRTSAQSLGRFEKDLTRSESEAIESLCRGVYDEVVARFGRA